MRKTKRITATLILITLIMSTFSIFTFSASAVREGSYTYTVSNNEVTITDVDTTINGDVTIPAELGGYPVVGIGEYAFASCTNIESIIIPDCVTEMGSFAFHYCTALEYVTISNSLTSIKSDSFSSCSKLVHIIIPDSVTSIGSSAFSGCTKLESIVIPNSVTTIDNYAFHSCRSLESIMIPSSVTSIGSFVLYGCESLENIALEQDNAVYHSKDNCLINTREKTLVAGCKTSIIPSDGSVTIIGAHAFSSQSAPERIIIPNTVISIGDYAFYECKDIEDIIIPESVASIGRDAFYGCTSLEKIHCSSDCYAKIYADENSINVELCSGGAVTCTSRKICDVCKNEYDKLAEHNFSVIQNDANAHWYKCASCDMSDIKHQHIFDVKKECTECGYKDIINEIENNLNSETSSVTESDIISKAGDAHETTIDISSIISEVGCSSTIGGIGIVAVTLGFAAVFVGGKKKSDKE